MRVLVTNDDGVLAPGILPLAIAMVEAGHDVVVAAPLVEASGSGAAVGHLSADAPVAVERVALAGLDGVPTYGVGGPPGLIVLAARLGALGPVPDLVVAGINPGANTGRAVLHSGTVGAALTAANFGLSGLAVSQGTRPVDAQWWETAAALAGPASRWLAAQPPATVLNLNVPNRRLDQLAGIRWAELAPSGTVRVSVDDEPDDTLRVELQLWGDDLPADCDAVLVDEGWATLTLLQGITSEPPADGLVESLEQVRPAAVG